MKKFISLAFLSIFTLSSFEALYAADNSKSHAKLYENSYTDLHNQVKKNVDKYDPKKLKEDVNKYLPFN
ncbi:MAG: hypothetical protein K2Y08_01065 [Alphaproteobacteria bacterium]|nr:hypothetical protein [Alphaproteobacteria bacterium]